MRDGLVERGRVRGRLGSKISELDGGLVELARNLFHHALHKWDLKQYCSRFVSA